MKGLMKASYGLATCRGWRGIGSARESVGESAGSCSVGRPRKR